MVPKFTVLCKTTWPAGKNKIILTFDDGPNPDNSISHRLLDILSKNEVQSTFCYIGKNIEQYPDVANRAYKEGHRLAHHTYSHTPLPLLSSRVLREEIDRTTELIVSITRSEDSIPTYFRSPWGIITPAVRKGAREKNLDIAYLTFFENEAWVGPSHHERKLDRIKNYLIKHQGGAIVLHENCYGKNVDKSWLPNAIDDLIQWSKDRGLRFTNYSNNSNTL